MTKVRAWIFADGAEPLSRQHRERKGICGDSDHTIARGVLTEDFIYVFNIYLARLLQIRGCNVQEVHAGWRISLLKVSNAKTGSLKFGGDKKLVSSNNYPSEVVDLQELYHVISLHRQDTEHQGKI